MISAVSSAFSFNRALHLLCSDLSSESEGGRREMGATESDTVPRVELIRDVTRGGEREWGGGEAAWGNEDTQDVSEASLEKLEFNTISA